MHRGIEEEEVRAQARGQARAQARAEGKEEGGGGGGSGAPFHDHHVSTAEVARQAGVWGRDLEGEADGNMQLNRELNRGLNSQPQRVVTMTSTGSNGSNRSPRRPTKPVLQQPLPRHVPDVSPAWSKSR